MKKITFLFILFILSLTNQNVLLSQTRTPAEVKTIEKLKNSTLYAVVDLEAHEKNAEYAKILEDYWTFSKIEIISPKEIGDYLKEGNFFLSLTVSYTEGFDFDKPAAFNSFYYSLWTPNADYLKKIKKKNDPDMEIDFGLLSFNLESIGLCFDRSDNFTIEQVMTGEYFGNGYPVYKGLGIFKNELQQLQSRLKTKRKEYYKSVQFADKEQILKMSKGVLYVPTAVFIDNSGFTLNNYKKNKKQSVKPATVFAPYSYKYKVVSMDELNNLILNSEEPIYYMVKVPYSSSYTISNSKTGEEIFIQINIGSTSRIGPNYLDKLLDIIEEEE